MNPHWTLAPAGLLLGAAMMWIFRRTADRQALGMAVKRIQAHLVEFWLFADEPALVGKFWGDLLAANVRLLRGMLAPLLILPAPMIPLFFLMDAIYGHSPLAVGRPALVTVGLARETPGAPILIAPDGIHAETPPVRIPGAREVSWRIRPDRAMSGALRVVLDGAAVEKSIRSGSGFALVSTKRTQSWINLIRNPAETPLPAGPVASIEVAYPSASVSLAGLEAHWSVWAAVFMLAGAILPAR